MLNIIKEPFDSRERLNSEEIKTFLGKGKCVSSLCSCGVEEVKRLTGTHLIAALSPYSLFPVSLDPLFEFLKAFKT